MNPLQPEKEFILRCMKALIFRKDLRVQMDSTFLLQLDWDWIVSTSYDHRLLGFVAFILGKRDLLKNLDDRVQEKLKAGLLENDLKNRLKQKQFQEVNRILNRKSIPVIPLKGVALTHLIYGDVPLRRMGDVDILLRQSDLSESFSLLAQAGFCRLGTDQSKNRWHEKIYAETASLWEDPVLGRLPLVRGEIEVDVHYNPMYRIEQKYVEMDIAGVWQRALPFPQLGPNVFMLDPKDLILHLLLHTLEFNDPRLIQALDTACVIEKYDIARSDISDQINVARHSRRVDAFVNAIHELMNADTGIADFSPETAEVFESFFSRKSISDETQEGLIESEDSVLGVEMFRKIRSPWKRLVFIAGYLLPNPDYYRHKGSKVPYFMHWWELITKVWKLGKLKFSKMIHPRSSA